MAVKQIGNENQEGDMSFLDHLEVLRWHLIRAVIAILVFTIVAFTNKAFVFDSVILACKDSNFWTYRMLCKLSDLLNLGDVLCVTDLDFEIIVVEMSGQFSMHLWGSFVAGLIIAFPYIMWELWRFLRPALRTNEKKYSQGAVFFTSFLFILGVLFGYYMIAPLSVNFLGGYQVSEIVNNRISLNSFISTVTTVTLACGLVFELPVVVYFFAKLGLLTPETMRKYRKHALVAVLVLSAVITPPDLMSQVLVSFPLLLLYEVGIRICRIVVKKS
jgi:sec-independent protein translocase protein TatC